MSDSKLEMLKGNQDALLLAEIVALLHDVGKFTNLHIEHHSRSDERKRKWFNDYAYKAVVDDPGAVIRLSRAGMNAKKPSSLNQVLSASSTKAADFLTADTKDYLQMTTIRFLNESYSLAELIMLGTPGFAENADRTILIEGKSGWLAAALGVCHSEAHHDKQETPPGEGSQNYPDVFISTAFGFEQDKVVTDSSPESLDNRLMTLSFPLSREQLVNQFKFGLGDTRRPINEITLADWAWTVSALLKSVMAEAIITRKQRNIRHSWLSWKEKLLDHDLRWRLLCINFDVLGLYSKAIKISDLLAYKDAVQRASKAVKQLVEEEYPLGNEVYRDTTGIYLTFPDLELWDELKDILCKKVEDVEPELVPRINVEQVIGNTAGEQLKKLLSEGRRRALKKLAYSFDDENLTDNWDNKWREAYTGSEICPVCCLLPMEEGAKACGVCLERRNSRVKKWQEEPPKTIWLDEIADHNDRVALIVGKFGLDDWLSGDLVRTMLIKELENKPDECKQCNSTKNPSPARLRRIWETCEKFWTETIEKEVLLQYDEYGKNTKNTLLRRARLYVSPDNINNWRENIPYDGNINGQPISLLWDDKQKKFLTIINLQLVAGDETTLDELIQKWRGQEAEVSDPDNNLQKHIYFKVQNVERPSDEFASYQPCLTVLTSADQFLSFIPASDAIDIADKIRQEYIDQFGKVQNRLPIFLGLVFFQRKTPLIAAVDVARRMLSQVSFSESSWLVCDEPASDGLNLHLPLSKNGECIALKVPVTMGDNVTEDIWYPYFFVTDSTEINGRKLCFQLKDCEFVHVKDLYKGRWLVHVKDLRKGDHVHITPSMFTYLFLESTGQRFLFDAEKHVLLLDDLPRLMEMWKSICRSAEMTQTKLKSIQTLFLNKQQLWRTDPECVESDKAFRQLVKTTLNRDKVQGVSVNEVMNGLFGHCLEIYLHILKLKVKDEKHEQEPATV